MLLTIPTSGSACHQQGIRKFSEFHHTEVRDISAKVQGDRGEPDVFEMISTHLFFNEKAISLQKNFRNCMPFELNIMNER